MNKLKIEYVDIDSIRPYENNAREHSREQIEQIKKSMQDFNNNDPIGVWNNIICTGHGRYMALKELGYTEIPIIRLDHLTDEQRKAYTLVHNKLTDNSTFNFELLEEELKSLQEFGLDMTDFGFTFESIDWASVDDLTESNYEEPKKEMLECPNCHHIDSKTHFKKVE